MEVAIIGGGLVGALEACLLAARGYKVTLFESRHDGRHEPSYYGRSINLAISHRGLSALRRLNLEGIVEKRAIPMRARMIHAPNGRTTPIPYDPDGRSINSIERAALNNYLLDEAEQVYKVELKFNHKLVDMDASSGELWFRRSNYASRRPDSGRSSAQSNEPGATSEQPAQPEADKLIKYTFDLVLGCDGARSNVRSLLARQTQLELEQKYIEHGYLELRIDPTPEGQYKMAENYLHIWPRGQYMMIALPNMDASFTCTLFMPFDILDKLAGSPQTEGLRFFKENFGDSVELIGAERIVSTLAEVRASPLISIKCSPYVYRNRVALLGDAAHAMVPFYGQGMNCGFEDCLVLDELLDEHLGPAASRQLPGSANGAGERTPSRDELASLMGQILEEYNRRRCPNGHAMCQLAMYNYIEMRDLVNTWSFRVRKKFDDLLYRLLHERWMPLYTMVTFSRIPIHVCIERRQRQDQLLARFWRGSLITLAASLAIGVGLHSGRRLLNQLCSNV